jgi:transcriptional regulator with XRE-family HTH domain
MARRKSKPPRLLSHHWYLAEWAVRLKVRQKDAIEKLGWSKAQASELFTGKQRYTQDLIDEVAHWLQLAPYELLMPPEDAIAIRDMRASAARFHGPVAFDQAAARKAV